MRVDTIEAAVPPPDQPEPMMSRLVLVGRTRDTGSLIDFAWRGVQDVPGQPSLWGVPID